MAIDTLLPKKLDKSEASYKSVADLIKSDGGNGEGGRGGY